MAKDLSIYVFTYKKPSFDIRVFGKRKGFGISTNRMTISQNGGKT